MPNLETISIQLVQLISSYNQESKHFFEKQSYSNLLKWIGKDEELFKWMVIECKKNNMALLPHLHAVFLSSCFHEHQIDFYSEADVNDAESIEQLNTIAYNKLIAAFQSAGKLQEAALLDLGLIDLDCVIPVLSALDNHNISSLVDLPNLKESTQLYFKTKLDLIEALKTLKNRIRGNDDELSLGVTSKIDDCYTTLFKPKQDMVQLLSCAEEIQNLMCESSLWNKDEQKILNAVFYGFIALVVVGTILTALALSGPVAWVGIAFVFAGLIGVGFTADLEEMKNKSIPDLVGMTKSLQANSQAFFYFETAKKEQGVNTNQTTLAQ